MLCESADTERGIEMEVSLHS